MKTHTGRLAGLVVMNEEVCIQIECPPLNHAFPGQYLLAFSAESSELLPTVLFPCWKYRDGIIFTGKIPKDWIPGILLSLRGPFGNGFHLPPLAKQTVLTTLDLSNINRLLMLAELALVKGAEVTLLTDAPTAQLAPEIEVLPISVLGEIKSWGDYFAAILPVSAIQKLNNELSLSFGHSAPFTAEIMVETPLVCADSIACGVCSVLTTKGWKHACKDGPVFSLDELVAEGNPHG
ncbi:MAG: hypothetical protein FD147_1097 [Chloroflexi bacterium]|nr:MAG: hypothetical protein FD147_1097 [Chloroflexota bacterium]